MSARLHASQVPEEGLGGAHTTLIIGKRGSFGQSLTTVTKDCTQPWYYSLTAVATRAPRQKTEATMSIRLLNWWLLTGSLLLAPAWAVAHPGVVNVRDQPYGAVGNGTTDDTAAITAAIAKVTGDGSNPNRVVYFPAGMYRITSTIEVPPNTILRGAGRFSTNLSGTNLTAAAIYKDFDGVAVRIVRRNPFPGSLFHMGGIEDMGFTGNGAADTINSAFIELGDRAVVNTATGAWNVWIQRATFNNSHGYGIYSAHSQEALIDANWFNAVKFPIYYNSVVASARITRNTFLDESLIPGAIAMQFRPGTLGGNAALHVAFNYVLGFQYGLWLTSIIGAGIIDNSFEGVQHTPIWLDAYLSDNVTQDGTGPVAAVIDRNTFINWAAAGVDEPAIHLSFTLGSFVGVNAYQSPNGVATKIIDWYDNDCNPQCTGNNVIIEPVLSGSGSAAPFRAVGAITLRNTLIGRAYYQPAHTTFANLGTAANGTQRFCSDCASPSSPCTGGSRGAPAIRIDGAWKCL